jgi:hypothetical protein
MGGKADGILCVAPQSDHGDDRDQRRGRDQCADAGQFTRNSGRDGDEDAGYGGLEDEVAHPGQHGAWGSMKKAGVAPGLLVP